MQAFTLKKAAIIDSRHSSLRWKIQYNDLEITGPRQNIQKRLDKSQARTIRAKLSGQSVSTASKEFELAFILVLYSTEAISQQFLQESLNTR